MVLLQKKDSYFRRASRAGVHPFFLFSFHVDLLLPIILTNVFFLKNACTCTYIVTVIKEIPYCRKYQYLEIFHFTQHFNFLKPKLLVSFHPLMLFCSSFKNQTFFCTYASIHSPLYQAHWANITGGLGYSSQIPPPPLKKKRIGLVLTKSISKM